MHNAIQISKLNDFIFSPKSILYHSIYESFSEILYHDTPQVVGRLAHENIDNGRYSTAKRYLQGIPVFSEKYILVGKIDIFDKDTNTLIERKNLVKNIYDGYILQLYAQMFCLEEVGYKVENLKIHSLQDNKRYSIPLPTKKDKVEFKKLLDRIRSFDPTKYKEEINPNKLDNCIYKIFYA
jgi:CRISPR-associated exonuclease Cas4